MRTSRGSAEALGLSRGGFGTKACVISDGAGRAVAFALAPGQAYDLPHAMPLLARLPDVPLWVVADHGYSSHSFHKHSCDLGARPAVLAKHNEVPVTCPGWTYASRASWRTCRLG